MSDFCDFVPDDPSCQTVPEPVDPVGPDNDGGEDMMMDDDMDKDMSVGMMQAQFAYLTIPLMIIGQSAGWTYRYSSYLYDVANVGGTASSTNYF